MSFPFALKKGEDDAGDGYDSSELPSSQDLETNQMENTSRRTESLARTDGKTAVEDNSRSDPTFTREMGSPEHFQAQKTDNIRGLARVFSNLSRNASRTTGVNPFEKADDPKLDPNSPEFEVERWLKSYLSITSKDKERYPQRSVGVSFRSLRVYGFGRDTDYQKDVLNVFLAAVQTIHGLFHASWKFPILESFDGLVRPGEICIVLGRPGRCVSLTFETG